MSPYLSFQRQCEEPFRFYAENLGGSLGPIFRYAGTTLMNDTSEAERILNALSRNGRVMMPLETTFWAGRFGMVVDQCGVPWLINCEGSDRPLDGRECVFG